MQHMVNTIKLTGFFISRQITRILHYHDRAVIPFGVAADRADLLICQCTADLAVADIISGIYNRLCKTLYLLLWHIDHMKSKSLRRFIANTGQ